MKLHNIKTKIAILSLTLLAFGACKRTTKEGTVGPEVISAPANFAVTTPLDVKPSSGTQLNMKTTYLYFTSKFSDTVTWKLVIKNTKNGASKTFNGTSDSISALNTTWRGEADYKLFAGKDNCIATLTIVGDLDENKQQKTYKKAFTIGVLGPQYLTTQESTNSGAFLDFDKVGTFPVQYGQLPDDPQALFKVSRDYNTVLGGAVLDDQNQKDVHVNDENGYSDVVNGSYAMHVEADDLNGDGFCGGFEFNTATSLVGKIKTTDPENAYINMYVRGFGKANSTCKVVIYELDSLSDFTPSKLQEIARWGNTNPAHPMSSIATHANLLKSTDKWEARITADWVGWKLVSIKYSAFKQPKSDACHGNCKLEPNKLRELSMEVESYPNEASPVEFALDYLVVSEGGAFKPW